MLCVRQVQLLFEGSQPNPLWRIRPRQDEGIWRCFRQFLEVSPCHRAQEFASLPLRHGGLGLRSAHRIHPAAHWASWANALEMINQRHPAVADIIVGAPGSDAESDSIRCLVDCARKLEEMVFEVPDWTDLAKGKVPGDEGEDDLCQPKIGWQKQAANSVEESFLNSTAWPSLEDSERALALSQRGPLASVPFVCFPTDRTRRFDSQPFRLLLLRRLGLPLPLSLRSCRCGRLDALDHHPAACANAGVLGRRGWALESPRREYAARQARECAPTFSPATWTWRRAIPWTEDALESWRTGCRYTEGLNSPLTQPWCHSSSGTAWH